MTDADGMWYTILLKYANLHYDTFLYYKTMPESCQELSGIFGEKSTSGIISAALFVQLEQSLFRSGTDRRQRHFGLLKIHCFWFPDFSIFRRILTVYPPGVIIKPARSPRIFKKDFSERMGFYEKNTRILHCLSAGAGFSAVFCRRSRI
ncbi:MAG: hypothetical protein U0L99_10740 [Ruminococcus sp.]|nr:hypothetical protein [Ruminococcus sp.]